MMSSVDLKTKPSAPPHVPSDLVIDFDFFSDPLFATDPFAAVRWQHEPGAPRIFYSPTHYLLPGCWVVTQAEDVRHVLQHPDLFSSRGGVGFSSLIGESWDLIPLEIDPPHHAAYRMLLNPLFSPKEVARLDAGVRAAATGLVEPFQDRSECEFVSAFAQPFPVSVFLRLLGLPLEDMPRLLEWEAGLLKSFSYETRVQSARSIVTYLRQAIEDRRAAPREDLISFTIGAEVNGAKLTDDEIIGICFLLFAAGLDTVASSLGFYFRHLASDQALQAKLRADRTLIPAAIEEFLRMYSIVISHRRVVVDTEIGEAQLKAGDWVAIPSFNGSRDPREFPNPDTFDLERSNNRHVAFAYGPHRCIGSHLARREFVVAINELFDRLPPFRLKEGAPLRTNGGAVFGVETMHLVWN